MAKESDRSWNKIGVRRGGGPPPGYEWNVELLPQVRGEARAFLTEDQYTHLARQVRELAKHDDPTHSETLDIRPVGELHELRETGGVLAKINGRVFSYRGRTGLS